MPGQVVKALEEEQGQQLGAPVFVRGQLRSYARLLNVDVSQLLEQAQVGPVVPPALVSHAHTPRARRIAENLGRRMLYVGITAVLARHPVAEHRLAGRDPGRRAGGSVRRGRRAGHPG
ncbi:hypothetical protein G6F68_020682 [Rhizopus microsporus]|nr:hypothetical protein G6F68_020682 [Rhizopus microsporus]